MRFHRFAYATLVSERPRSFQTRDGAAFCELTAGFRQPAWEYGSLIFNYPAVVGVVPPGKDFFAFVRRDDWVILTTRPPIHDRYKPLYDGESPASRPPINDQDVDIADKKHVRRSDSDLERHIFAELGSFFTVCKRSEIKLTPGFAKACRGESGIFNFKQYEDASLVAYNTLGEGRNATPVRRKPRKTIAFFVIKKSIAQYPRCGLIACFGMGGIETLIWNHIVRTRYSDWLHLQGRRHRNLPPERFVISELTIPETKDLDHLRPVTLDFVNLGANGVQPVSVEILLDVVGSKSIAALAATNNEGSLHRG